MASEVPASVATEDLTGTCWRDDMWLSAFGLHHGNLLDYFALSPFYDRSCNNERGLLQGKPRSQPPLLGEGVEYLLADSQPPHLFILRKLYRHGGGTAGTLTTLAFYYILDGSVYQAPSLQAALQARMQRCMFSLKAAFRDMQQDLAPLAQGGVQHDHSALERELAAGREAPRAVTAADREAAQRVEASVRHVLRQFPLPVPAAAAAQPEGAAAAAVKAEPEPGAATAAPATGGTAAAPAAGAQQQLLSAAGSLR